ncbi:class E sortase [Kutzneria viridogrisea]|nr:class E sortase [Kutzneria albida]
MPPPRGGRPAGWRPRPGPDQPTEFIPRIDVIEHDNGADQPTSELYTHRSAAEDDTAFVDDIPYYEEDEEDEAPPPPKETGRKVVRTIGELFITAGMVILLFVVYEVYWTDLISAGKQNQATSSLDTQWKDTVGDPGNQRGTHYDLTEGQGFAKIYIPALGPDYHFTLVEGTTDADLDIGPGHYKGTALPGEPGNFAVAGHRVGKGAPFNDLDLVSSCDAIVVETKTDWFVYRMMPKAEERASWDTSGKGTQPRCKGVKIGGAYSGVVGQETVLPSQGDVIAPVPHQPEAKLQADKIVKLMTLTTCTPKFSASHRLILHAVLTNSYHKDPAHPDVTPTELKETD